MKLKNNRRCNYIDLGHWQSIELRKLWLCGDVICVCKKGGKMNIVVFRGFLGEGLR